MKQNVDKTKSHIQELESRIDKLRQDQQSDDADAAAAAAAEIANLTKELEYAKDQLKWQEAALESEAELAELEKGVQQLSKKLSGIKSQLSVPFSSKVVNFFCDSAKNRNVQRVGGAVLFAGVAGVVAYFVPSVLTSIVSLIGTAAAATFPPLAVLMVAAAVVGFLVTLAAQFAYEKYQAKNSAA